MTRDFALGQVALEALRRAARAELTDRRLADGILEVIAGWESSASPASAWSRNDLRARVKQLLGSDLAAAPASSSRPDPTKAMYDAGLRGQRR